MSELAKASREFFKRLGNTSECTFKLTPEFISEAEALREEIREEERGGGMCHIVTEVLQHRYGWERLYVTYLTADGDIICPGGHVINVLPDGSIVDPTRDQFGEGYSVSHIKPDSHEIGRYRPEFYDDYYPGHPEYPELDAWLPFYHGKDDTSLGDDIKVTKERGYWLTDRRLLDAYDDKQREYGGSRYRV